MTTPIERAAEEIAQHTTILNLDDHENPTHCTCGERFRNLDGHAKHRVSVVFESIDPEEIERRLVREWHKDQCMCREFDGEDVRTCHTNRENPYRIMPPGTWAVEAVIAHLTGKEQS